MFLPGYKHFGGRHSDTSSLKNVLAYLGVTAPHTGKPFSEAMLLGVGGGIGGGYWTFEFGHYPVLVLGSRHQWQGNILPGIGQRLGIPLTTQETSSPKAAERSLREAVAAGHPAIVWAAIQQLPYYAFQTDPTTYHTLVVYGWDDETHTVYVADRSRKPLTLTPVALAAARANTWAPKHRAILVEPPKKLKNLKGAITEGIRACVKELQNPPIRNFGLPSLPKWADLVANPKDKKGWPQVFKTSGQLYGALKSAYFFIELANGAGALRPLYADFLTEASEVTSKPALNEIAAHYRVAAKLWTALADAALPNAVAPYNETRKLLARKQKLFEARGAAALPELHELNARLDAVKAAVSAESPLSPEDTSALLADLRTHITRVYEAEMAAVETLSRLVK
jgi:hypothetical protein